MIIKIGHRNQRAFRIGGPDEIPPIYQEDVKRAVEQYQKESRNPYQSRTYQKPGSVTVHVQERESPRRTRVC